MEGLAEMPDLFARDREIGQREIVFRAKKYPIAMTVAIGLSFLFD